MSINKKKNSNFLKIMEAGSKYKTSQTMSIHKKPLKKKIVIDTKCSLTE
jgi:hypothetical protein